MCTNSALKAFIRKPPILIVRQTVDARGAAASIAECLDIAWHCGAFGVILQRAVDKYD
jgi:hypothetical protein